MHFNLHLNRRQTVAFALLLFVGVVRTKNNTRMQNTVLLSLLVTIASLPTFGLQWQAPFLSYTLIGVVTTLLLFAKREAS